MTSEAKEPCRVTAHKYTLLWQAEQDYIFILTSERKTSPSGL